MIDQLIEKYFKDVIADNPKIVDEIDTIFEAAVNDKVSEKLTEKENELEEKNKADIKVFKDEIVEKLDEYISLSMEEFVEETKTDIESGMKVELAEKTLDAVKNIFTGAAIEIPKGEEDVVANFEKKIEKLEEKINENVNNEIENKKQLFEFEKAIKFAELTEDLPETKKEKLFDLTEDIDCSDIESFAKKVTILKENIVVEKDEKDEKDLKEEIDKDKNKNNDLDKYLP